VAYVISMTPPLPTGTGGSVGRTLP
jgi:hypothetical protein